ncbi:hypothetical protein HYH03_000061 [Edaphochlamys debaryana]|uniref:Rho-GAP domain-containing protein n=1 Tax=Edaphochlamys debaryana TaxID=47281 RepID=A0A835YGW8_9CHLO|nr:hypothetical protein HYH03_000061 [Edaphochlamys debaryana]|eukprot:KAG2501554.1 hypothetical protein HYH03_000061 [Edaphochlamys debaryana]
MCTTRMLSECGPTFGVALKVLCERSQVEVPPILADLLRHLASRALHVPDAFADAPKCAATSQLKGAIDSGLPLTTLLDSAHPTVVGSLLKRWLEELPDPLLNWDQQVELLSACKDEGSIEERIASLNDAIALVCHITLGTLKPLLLFLQQYCFRQRRFDQQLLQVAVAFAPILFPAALAAGPAELRLAEETVATLVSNALHVFNPTLAANVPVVTPQALCEAAAEMLGSEAEAEGEEAQQGPCVIMTEGEMEQSVVASWPAADEVVRHGSSGGGAGLVERPGSPSCSRPTSSGGGYPHPPLPHGHHAAGEAAMYDEHGMPYEEPCLQDADFMAQLDGMVYGITSSLFGDDEDMDEPMASAAAPYKDLSMCTDDDCASLASTPSFAGTSFGGASHSSFCTVVGAASLSGAFASDSTLASPRALAANEHFGPAAAKPGSCTDMPYSPGAVLVPPPPDHDAHTSAGDGKADASQRGAAAAALAELAELAKREVAAGGVFVVVSAQPGTGIKPGFGAFDGLGSGEVPHHLQPLAAAEVAGMLLEQAVLLSSAQDANVAASRHHRSARPTEGGAQHPAGPEQSHQHQHHKGLPVGARRALSRLSTASGPDAPTPTTTPRAQRRMTMGGEEHDPGLPSPSSHHHQSQPNSPSQHAANARQLQPNGPAALQQQQRSEDRSSGGGARGSSGGGAQRRRQTMGGSSGGAGPASPPSSPAGWIELGVAGHLSVSITPTRALAVRELPASDAAAAAHRVPIRSLAPVALGLEKERLKRQLKEVAAAYQAVAGKPLTPELKEPLRCVYVRYHKIKALLAGGAGSSGGGAAGCVPAAKGGQLTAPQAAVTV